MRFFGGDEQSDLERLFTRCRRGDAEAWNQLVVRFQNLVYSVARRTGLGEDDAADIFQSTFLALYRNLDRIDNAATLPKLLAVTASRDAIRLHRQTRLTHSLHDEDTSLDKLLASEDQAVDSMAIDSVLAEEWRIAVAQLGGRCSDLIQALYFEDKAYEAIAAELGIPMGAIGPTRARCLEKLRKVYQERQKETPF